MATTMMIVFLSFIIDYCENKNNPSIIIILAAVSFFSYPLATINQSTKIEASIR